MVSDYDQDDGEHQLHDDSRAFRLVLRFMTIFSQAFALSFHPWSAMNFVFQGAAIGELFLVVCYI